MENGVFTLKTHQMFYVVNYAGEIWKRNNYICHVGCMRLGRLGQRNHDFRDLIVFEKLSFRDGSA